jgi:transcriptional regulator with XRE-family HTH domain
MAQAPPIPGLREIRPYTRGVPRKLAKPRPAQAQRLVALRQAAGLSQAELAQAVGESQANIAFWERSEKPPRSDVLPKLAQALGVRIDELIEGAKATTQRAPAGKVQHLFEEVRKLPRRKQDRVVEVLSALLKEYKLKAS